MCLASSRLLGCSLSPRIIFLAALWHDYGKVWDYEPTADGGWKNTSHKYRIHHIQRSAFEFQRAVITQNRDVDWLSTVDQDEIVHAILAHHCEPEWGSAVRPQTKLAWILHTCDQMSARVYESKGG